MATDQLFIGIDSGTQGTKVIIFSRNQGAVIAQGQASHTLNEAEGGRREQDPEEWWAALNRSVAAALGEARVRRDEIKAIAVSGQQHGLVPVDAEGRVIRPAKLWCDTETAPQCDTLTQRLGGETAVRAQIGNSIAAGFTASKLLWLKETEPANYERLRTALLPHDYLNYRLTGETKTEFGDASGTAYFDIRRRCWSEEVLKAIDSSRRLLACMPELIAADEPNGTLKPTLADRWGLPGNVLVAAGGGDNMMAAIGTGNVQPGVLTASLGTSGTLYAYSNQPVVDNEGELAAFCDSTGGWLPLVCTMNVTVATELIRSLLGLGIEELNDQADQALPGAEGILLLPFFNGERTPALPSAKATISGVSSMNLTPANLCRAAMEGATLGLRYGLDVLGRNGILPREVRLVGGGAQSAVWRQILADIFQQEVISPASTEAGALGAALQAMWCYCQRHEGPTQLAEICAAHIHLDQTSRTLPRRRESGIYQEIYAQYRELERTMRPINQAAP